jgi:hypothetical protein
MDVWIINLFYADSLRLAAAGWEVFLSQEEAIEYLALHTDAWGKRGIIPKVNGESR